MIAVFRRYLAAFARFRTYDVRSNAYWWFGLAWGLPIPVFSILLDLSLGADRQRSLPDVLNSHPVHYLFLLHPILFALAFGAMGTVRHELEDENRDLIERLTRLASTDALTGVFNRRFVLEELQKAIQRSDRAGTGFSVLLFDLDGFKAVNDTRGHLEGDEALRRTAQAIRGVTREGDVLGRYGGDEFLMVAYGDMASALGLVARAAEQVRAAAGLGVSAGVAQYPQDGTAAERLIGAADLRLAELKRARHEGKPAGSR